MRMRQFNGKIRTENARINERWRTIKSCDIETLATEVNFDAAVEFHR
jgi:hypothetical protein